MYVPGNPLCSYCGNLKNACVLILYLHNGAHGERGSPIVHVFILYCSIKKGKAVLLQAWSGPEGSRKLRFPYFMTTAQDGGKVVSLTHRPPLPPGNTPDTHYC